MASNTEMQPIVSETLGCFNAMTKKMSQYSTAPGPVSLGCSDAMTETLNAYQLDPTSSVGLGWRDNVSQSRRERYLVRNRAPRGEPRYKPYDTDLSSEALATRLSNLPTELRLDIYGYIFGEGPTDINPSRVLPNNYPDLLLTNYPKRDEAVLEYLRTQDFKSAGTGTQDIYKWLGGLWPSQVAEISSICFLDANQVADICFGNPGRRKRLERYFKRHVGEVNFTKKGLAKSAMKIALPCEPILSDTEWRGKEEWVAFESLGDWEKLEEVVDDRPLVWFEHKSAADSDIVARERQDSKTEAYVAVDELAEGVSDLEVKPDADWKKWFEAFETEC